MNTKANILLIYTGGTIGMIKDFETKNKAEIWTIGLIAPYKAQAVLLNKLITSYGISETIKVYS